MPFGVVSGVGRGMGVLDGIDVLQGGGRVREVSRSFLHRWFEWRIVEQKCIRLMCEKLTIFPCGQYIVGNVFYCLSDFLSGSRSKWGFAKKCKKCNTISDVLASSQQIVAPICYTRRDYNVVLS